MPLGKASNSLVGPHGCA